MNNGKLEVRTNCIPFGNVTKMENLQSKDIIKITGKEQYNLPFFFFFAFLGPHMWHMKIPRLGVHLELQLPGYATATAT